MADDIRDTRAIRMRLESGKVSRPQSDDGETRSSILESVLKLKEQILEKDRIINARTSELVAARDYLLSVLAALADAVFVVDPDGVLEFANHAAHELLGYRPGELLGLRATALLADPDQAGLFQGEGLAEALREGSFQRSDLVLRARDGQRVPVTFSSSVLRDPAQPLGLVGIARDVRVERRLEEEKLRAVQALAASVAHEIRNPLGAIVSSVALLIRDLRVEGEDRTLLTIVHDETQRIAGIVTQFLDFARPIRLDAEPTDLGALLREVVVLAEKDERAKGKQVLVHADEDLGPISLDPSLVRQVVWNLVKNALDAATSRVALRVRAGGGGGLEVRVADDGPGMPPETLARCFEAFHTTKAQGTGLGLTISKRIIEAHGGTLRLESAVGFGTTASFTLPRDGPG